MLSLLGLAGNSSAKYVCQTRIIIIKLLQRGRQAAYLRLGTYTSYGAPRIEAYLYVVKRLYGTGTSVTTVLHTAEKVPYVLLSQRRLSPSLCLSLSLPQPSIPNNNNNSKSWRANGLFDSDSTDTTDTLPYSCRHALSFLHYYCLVRPRLCPVLSNRPTTTTTTTPSCSRSRAPSPARTPQNLLLRSLSNFEPGGGQDNLSPSTQSSLSS